MCNKYFFTKYQNFKILYCFVEFVKNSKPTSTSWQILVNIIVPLTTLDTLQQKKNIIILVYFDNKFSPKKFIKVCKNLCEKSI